MTKDKEKRMTPEIRFKGFSGDWEQRKLGSESKILTGGTPKTSIPEYWEPKKIPWMSSGEVNKRRLDGTDNMISEEGLNNSSARWVKKYSVLIALAGQGKTRGTVAVNNIQLTTNQSIAAIVPNDNLYYEFIYQNLIKRYDELRMISSGDGTRGGLNKQIVSDIVMPSPSRDEQYKIGTFFKQLDDTIALHQQKYELLIKLKKAYLQLIFPKTGESTPKVRFADFHDNWEQCKLGDLGSVAMNKRIFKNQTSENGEVPFFKIGTFGSYPDAFISRKLFEEYKSKYPYPEVGDILISASGSIGRTVVYQGEDEYFQDSNIVWLKHNGRLDNKFLKQFYSIVKWQGLEGSTIKRLYNKNILDTNISVPTLAEQNKLGAFFEQLENAITLRQQKVASLKSLKQAYLQKMFV